MTLVRSLLLVSAFSIFTPSSGSTGAPLWDCVGCFGTGGSGNASGGTCGATAKVTITVEVRDGECKWWGSYEPFYLDCRQFKSCLPVITRTWENLPANIPLDFCVTLHGDTLCLNPKPSSGGGTSTDTRNSAPMPCNDDPSNTREYCVSAPSCGLEACAEARCSSCNG